MSTKVLSFPREPAAARGAPPPPDGRAPATLTPDEQLVLDAYFDEALARSLSVDEACDRLDVPADVYHCERVAAAVGQILVQNIQGSLPQVAFCRDGKAELGRKYRARPKGRGLEFLPRHLLTINWADTAPGLSWPEAYHLVYIPGRHRYVVVASVDCPGTWGCTDMALGHFDADEDKLLGARRIIAGHWRPADGSDAMPWEYVFDPGLVDRETAERWRREVWHEPEFDEYFPE